MILTITNQKGGAGKTTLALNIAAEWASQGARVKLIDMDKQHSALDWLETRDELGHPPLFDLEGYPTPNLHKHIHNKAQGFDHVIIDVPPQVDALAKSAMACADLVIVPVKPSPPDIWAAASTIDLLHDASVLFEDLDYRFCMTQKLTNAAIGRDARRALGEYEDVEMLEQTIGYRVDFMYAFGQGLSVGEYAHLGKAHVEMKRLVKEIDAWFEAHRARHTLSDAS